MCRNKRRLMLLGHLTRLHTLSHLILSSQQLADIDLWTTFYKWASHSSERWNKWLKPSRNRRGLKNRQVHPPCMTWFGFHMEINELCCLVNTTLSSPLDPYENEGVWTTSWQLENLCVSGRGYFPIWHIMATLVKDCGASEILTGLKDNKWAWHHFTDIGRK